MKTIICSGFVLIFLACLFLAIKSITAKQPKAGLTDGRLRMCPDSPNCVVSENATALSRVEPLALPLVLKGEPDKAWSVLRETVLANGGTIQQEQADYLWATFTSRIFRFVDDVEFRLDAANNMIHVRSASRAGYSDFGVNRKRVEKIRAAFSG